ncbi:hypothetical protein PSUB009319_29320 [Ralstonia sp. SET104]|nr:hypothetical protein PSUB009319_29320 [Ralstonia sp. SET104]
MSQSKYSRAPAFSARPVSACEPDSGKDWMTLISAWAAGAINAALYATHMASAAHGRTLAIAPAPRAPRLRV